MRAAGRAGRTIVLRLRFGDYTRATRSHTLCEATAATEPILAAARALLAAALPTIEQRGCTLVGMAVTNLGDGRAVQLALPFDGRAARPRPTLDEVRDRFGPAAVTRATLLGRDPASPPTCCRATERGGRPNRRPSSVGTAVSEAMSTGSSSREQLLHEIRAARAQLPLQHRVLLEQIGTQEVAIAEWPSGVQDLYRTLRAAPPAEAELADAAAVYLDELRTIAFNASRLHELIFGLTDEWRRRIVAGVAWHEYGHALSLTRSTVDQRREAKGCSCCFPRAYENRSTTPAATAAQSSSTRWSRLCTR